MHGSVAVAIYMTPTSITETANGDIIDIGT
jgi:hypothetical protein